MLTCQASSAYLVSGTLLSTKQAALNHALRDARIAAGFTQEEAARLLGKHPMTVSRWERDKNPSRPSDEDLDRAAALYGTTTSKLRYPGQQPASSNGEAATPRVMQGLPQRIRVWLQEFLLEITKAGANEREVDAARRLLESPELYTLYAGGLPKEMSEDDWMMNLELSATHIRHVLKKRGRKLSK